MKEKIKELIDDFHLSDFRLSNFRISDIRISDRRTVIIAAGAGLVGLCLCLILFSVVGSIFGDDQPAAVVEMRALPTLVHPLPRRRAAALAPRLDGAASHVSHRAGSAPGDAPAQSRRWPEACPADAQEAPVGRE